MVRSKLPLFAALLAIGLTSTNGVPLDQTVLKKECDIASLSAGDECQLAWSDLKPVLHATQNMLGIAWVMYKADKYMGSLKDAQKELDDKVVPVVKGPDDVLYCLDHHHLLAALDYAGAPLVSAKAVSRMKPNRNMASGTNPPSPPLSTMFSHCSAAAAASPLPNRSSARFTNMRVAKESPWCALAYVA